MQPEKYESKNVWVGTCLCVCWTWLYISFKAYNVKIKNVSLYGYPMRRLALKPMYRFAWNLYFWKYYMNISSCFSNNSSNYIFLFPVIITTCYISYYYLVCLLTNCIITTICQNSFPRDKSSQSSSQTNHKLFNKRLYCKLLNKIFHCNFHKN